MGDDHHRHTLLCELLHKIQYLADHLGVQSGGRLVKEDHLGIHCKSAHNRNSLLLTARKRGGIYVRFFFKADAAKKRHCILLGLGLDLGLGRFERKERLFLFLKKVCKPDKEILSLLCSQVSYADVNRCEHNVFFYGFVIKQIELLEHHADVLAMLVDIDAHVGNIHTVEDDRAARGVLHAVDATKEGGFTASRRADDGNLLTVADIKVNAAKNLEIAEFFC